ncbi:MAG: hypothetical protein R6W74_06565, partial [Nitrosomonas halophila]
MENFSKKILVASIVLAFGAAGNAWANPTNTAAEGFEGDQHASVNSYAEGTGTASSSEGSTSTVGDV